MVDGRLGFDWSWGLIVFFGVRYGYVDEYFLGGDVWRGRFRFIIGGMFFVCVSRVVFYGRLVLCFYVVSVEVEFVDRCEYL